MEEADIKAPLYYVMGRKAEVDAVQLLLTITPCYYGVACNADEKALLQYIVTEVLQGNDVSACQEIASHLARTEGRPVLIVGDGKELKAVYSTGEEETICWCNPTGLS